ncbi:MAG: outer membrane protein transport protein [Myxococcaceae bacterium]|nr:outer membrane protein transport protein [Myxococcaceae bacterium]
MNTRGVAQRINGVLTVAAGLWLALVGGPADASGILVDTQSGRATGMASAVTADAPDPSAVLFNPAEIVREEHPNSLAVQVGDTLLIPTNVFRSPSGEETRGVTPVVPPFTGYATYNLDGKLAFGLGVVNLYGLKIRWPDDWAGQELIREAELTTYFINPEVAYRFGRIKVGAGVQVVRGTVRLRRAIRFPDTTGQIELAGGAWGVGGNAGINVELIDDLLQVGATYRSRVKLNFNEGTAHFSGVPAEFAGSEPGQLRDQTAKTSITLPDWVTLGLSLRPLKALHVNFDAQYFTWQAFPALRINFEDPTLNQVEPKRWHHTWNFHLGAEYGLSRMFTVRAGAMWDNTPNPDDTLGPDIPDSDRVNLAAGLGFHLEGFTVDAAYQYVIFLEHTSTLPTFPGSYEGHVHIVGLSVGYRHAF